MNFTQFKIAKDKESLKCVLVSKGHSVEEISKVLAETGLKRIGENRLKEAEEKFPKLDAKIEKHFIGKLQSRKIAKIVKLFDVIQSVENLKQARMIEEYDKPIKIFLQINLNGDPLRQGASPYEAKYLIEEIKKLKKVTLLGVMGIASKRTEDAMSEFALLKSLQGDLPECSMGMSKDYSLAIKAGSTMLRLGRVLFETGLPKDIKVQ